MQCTKCKYFCCGLHLDWSFFNLPFYLKASIKVACSTGVDAIILPSCDTHCLGLKFRCFQCIWHFNHRQFKQFKRNNYQTWQSKLQLIILHKYSIRCPMPGGGYPIPGQGDLDLGPVINWGTPRKGHGTSGSIMGWRWKWGTPGYEGTENITSRIVLSTRSVNIICAKTFAVKSLETFRTEYSKLAHKRSRSRITDGQLFQTIMDLFIGGTETTTNTLRWMLLYLINNPDVQKKCQEEINKVMDFNFLPFWVKFSSRNGD